ncbi:MAG: class I SAM-dependent methyltransferase, partial [Candidatus Aminicenantes bacterium]
SVLDIGCGTGRLLELLGQKGNLLRVGIELNIERASFARKTAQCDIYQIPVEKFIRHQNREFDIITLMNVLSHIPSFDRLFDAIHSLLADHGKLILKVGECTRNVKKDAYHDWGIPDHLHFLGMNTLAFICREYGFKILRHERLPLSEELFSKDRWETPGRSPIRNIIKQVVAATPLALPLLKKIYDLRSGQAVYSSFVVLTQNS